MSIPRTLILTAFFLPGSPALADDAAPAPAPAPAPAFGHLGPDGQSSEINAALGITIPIDGGDFTLFRVRLGGQGVDPKTGLGGYASIGFAGVTGSGDSETALGGLELGGLYRVTASPEVDAVFRAGVVLPTASEDSEAYLYGTYWQDPSNLVTSASQGTVIRLAASPTYRRDNLYLRADLGFDISVTERDDEPLVHADLGIGFAPAPVGGALEIQTLCTTSDVDDRCVHLFAANAQFAVGARGVARVGLSVPVGEDDLGRVFTLEAGFTSRF